VAPLLRGDIVWADLDPARGSEQAGRRPVLILSEDVFNARLGTPMARASNDELAQILEGLWDILGGSYRAWQVDLDWLSSVGWAAPATDAS
jgi:hypothetical protein